MSGFGTPESFLLIVVTNKGSETRGIWVKSGKDYPVNINFDVFWISLVTVVVELQENPWFLC
jgi:hypothetical protein